MKDVLCAGGADKITLVDVYQKNIIREIEDKGAHICLYKLNDNILLTGKDSPYNSRENFSK